MTERTEKNEGTIANRRFAKGGFLILTHVDTDVLAFHRIADSLDPEFAPVRVYNVSNLRDEDDAITFYDQVVPNAQVVFLKLLGGRASLPGLYYTVKLIEGNGQWPIAGGCSTERTCRPCGWKPFTPWWFGSGWN